jgi:hypothetical protein
VYPYLLKIPNPKQQISNNVLAKPTLARRDKIPITKIQKRFGFDFLDLEFIWNL